MADAGAIGPLHAIEWRTEPGCLPYPDALAAMAARAASIREGTAGELVWLVEHPPLYTSGTSARPVDLSNPAGLPVYAAGRGGQWTYHGPGQRVAYVLLDLMQPHGIVPPRDIRLFVHGLETWLITALARLGIAAERRAGRIGLWVAEDGRESKIAAIGVRVTRWVSGHGISLNVAPDLGHFDGIVPCGIREHGVTSLAALGCPATMDAVDAALRAAWDDVFATAPCGSPALAPARPAPR